MKVLIVTDDWEFEVEMVDGLVPHPTAGFMQVKGARTGTSYLVPVDRIKFMKVVGE